MTYRRAFWISLDFIVASCVGASIILLANHYMTTKTVPDLSFLLLAVQIIWSIIGYVSTGIGVLVGFILRCSIIATLISTIVGLTYGISIYCRIWWYARVWFRLVCAVMSIGVLAGVWIFTK